MKAFNSRPFARRLAPAVLLAFAQIAPSIFAQFNYSIDQTEITITGYTGGAGPVDVPALIEGLPVTHLSKDAFFSNPNPTHISIPASVRVIDDGALGVCGNLVQIDVDPQNAYFSSRDGVLFDKNTVTLLQYPSGKSGSYTIPDGIKDIGFKAFLSATKLTAIGFPASVQTIGEGSFGFCSGLKQVTIGSGVKVINDSAFWNCTNLTTVAITGSVSRLGSYAFGYTGLTRMDIPLGLTAIEGLSFAFCTKLVTLTIPSSVTTIAANSFYGCATLSDVYFKGNCPVIEQTAFDNANAAVFYYFSGTTGWASSIGGHPTRLWNPSMAVSNTSDQQLALRITGTSGLRVVVESTADMARGLWASISTNTLGQSALVLTQTRQPDKPSLVYRLRAP